MSELPRVPALLAERTILVFLLECLVCVIPFSVATLIDGFVRFLVTIVCFSVLCLFGVQARAQALYTLSWERSTSAQTCVSSVDLRASVERLLGRELASSGPAMTKVQGQATRDEPAGRWRATLELIHDGEVLGQRSFESSADSCRDLDDTLSLSIALMLDPDAVLATEAMAVELSPSPNVSQPPSEEGVIGADADLQDAPLEETPADEPPAEEPLDESPVDPNAEVSTSASSESDSRRPWRFEIRGSGALAVGRTAPLTFGGLGAFAFEPPRFWAVEIAVGGWGNAALEGQEGEADVTGLDVHLGLCPDFLVRNRVRLGACLAGSLGWLFATGRDLSTNREATAITFSFLISGRFRLRLWRALGMNLGVGMVVPTIRPRIVYEDAEGEVVDIYRPPPVGLLVELGISLNFFSERERSVRNTSTDG